MSFTCYRNPAKMFEHSVTEKEQATVLVKLKYMAPLLRIVNQTEEEVSLKEGSTVETLIRHLAAKHGPAFKEYFYNKEDKPKLELIIIINSRFINDLKTVLTNGAEIVFTSPIGGG